MLIIFLSVSFNQVIINKIFRFSCLERNSILFSRSKISSLKRINVVAAFLMNNFLEIIADKPFKNIQQKAKDNFHEIHRI